MEGRIIAASYKINHGGQVGRTWLLGSLRGDRARKKKVMGF